MQQSVIEQIKHRLPIADVLASYITLQQSGGGQYKAKCPFHNERTASFSVSSERGVYYCFGCGAKGDIFSFVQQFEGLDFKATLKMLADRAGIPLTSHDVPSLNSDAVYDAIEHATVLYQAQLALHPEAKEYLLRRGLTEESIAEFRIGYAPVEWRFIATQAQNGHGVQSGVQSAQGVHNMHNAQQLDIYERAGLIKKTDKGYYDRFRGRIMFPLSDSVGRVVAFSGRMFPDTPEGPKYLNSPETELFQKSHILFGFDKAKHAIKKNNFAILVEGQMDIVLSHQYGFKNTVATSGTAVSEQGSSEAGAQLAVISRLTPNLFLAFDGDSAGEKALARAAVVALALGMNPKVVALPQGRDPADQLVAEGAEVWKQLLQQSQHFIMHALSIVRRDSTSNHTLARGMREKIFPYLLKIASPVERQLYVDALAKDLDMTSTALTEELQLLASQKTSSYSSRAQVGNNSNGYDNANSAYGDSTNGNAYAGAHAKSSASDTRKKQSLLSGAERLFIFVERFVPDQMESIQQAVQAITFDDQSVPLPVLSEEEKIRAFAIIEQEYGALDAPALALTAKELLQKVADAFFVEMRTLYTAKMRDADRNGDTALADELLQKLQHITTRLHNAPISLDNY